MATAARQWAREVAREAARSGWTEGLGRAGLVARGVVYCLVAVIALRVATGHRGEADRQGALRVGFLGYAAWRLVKAAIGAREGATDHGEAVDDLRRVGDAALGLLYIAF